MEGRFADDLRKIRGTFEEVGNDGGLRGDNAEDLLRECEEELPWSSFVVSVREQFEESGRISAKQAQVLEEMLEELR